MAYKAGFSFRFMMLLAVDSDGIEDFKIILACSVVIVSEGIPTVWIPALKKC